MSTLPPNEDRPSQERFFGIGDASDDDNSKDDNVSKDGPVTIEHPLKKDSTVTNILSDLQDNIVDSQSTTQGNSNHRDFFVRDGTLTDRLGQFDSIPLDEEQFVSRQFFERRQYEQDLDPEENFEEIEMDIIEGAEEDDIQDDDIQEDNTQDDDVQGDNTQGNGIQEKDCLEMAEILVKRLAPYSFDFEPPMLQAFRKWLVASIAARLLANRPQDRYHNTLVRELTELKEQKDLPYATHESPYVNDLEWDHKQKLMYRYEAFVARLAGIYKKSKGMQVVDGSFYFYIKKSQERQDLRRVFDHQSIVEDCYKRAAKEIEQIDTAIIQIFKPLQLWKYKPKSQQEEANSSSHSENQKGKDPGKKPGESMLRKLGLDAFPDVYNSLLETVGYAYKMIYKSALLEIKLDQYSYNEHERFWTRIKGNRAKNAKEFLKEGLDTLKQDLDTLKDQNTAMPIGEDLLAVRFLENPVQEDQEFWRVPTDGLLKAVQENAYLGGAAHEKEIKVPFPPRDFPEKSKEQIMEDIYNTLLKDVFHLVEKNANPDEDELIDKKEYPHLWGEIEYMYSGNSPRQLFYQYTSETKLLKPNKKLSYKQVRFYVGVHHQAFAKLEELKAEALKKNFFTRLLFWWDHGYKFGELKEKAENVKIAEDCRFQFNQDIKRIDHLEEGFATKNLAAQVALAASTAKSYIFSSQEARVAELTKKFQLHVNNIESDLADKIGTKVQGVTFAQWFNTAVHIGDALLRRNTNNTTNPRV